MKSAFGFAALLACASAFGLDRPAPQVRLEAKIVEVGPGVISADFSLNFGHVYANFPSDMAAGDRVSGSLAAVPTGKSDAERSANAAPLGALEVEICDSKFAVASGLFVCPRVSPNGIDVLLDIQPVARLLVQPRVTVPSAGPSIVLPTEGIAAGRSRILGPFGGDLSATLLLVGGGRARVVAESPRSCIFDVPAAPTGPGRIELRDGANAAAGPFRIIGLHLTPPRPIIHRGDTTSFGAEVTGLAGLEHPLSLLLKNLSAGVVSMEGGDQQTLTIPPRSVSANGTFAISRRLTGIHRGDYVVNVSVPWEEAAVKDAAEADSAGGSLTVASRVSLDDAMKRLPSGYKIVHGKDAGFHAEPDSLRPGLPLAWDEVHGTWTPPGFVPDPTDPDRAFNRTTGGNAVWDDKSGRWIDSRNGEPLSYAQDNAGKQLAPSTDHSSETTTHGGRKGTGVSFSDAMKKLPSGYKIVHGKDAGFFAEPDSLRPGLPLAWDEVHGTWTPPGFVPDPTDPDRAFNRTTGGNAVWDDKSGRWIDAKTGNPLSYEQ